MCALPLGTTRTPIKGHFEHHRATHGTFVCEGSDIRIHNCVSGVLGLEGHALGMHVRLTVQDATNGVRTVFVPRAEINHIFPGFSAQHRHGLGRAFAEALRSAQTPVDTSLD